jgi:hypothetical protein
MLAFVCAHTVATLKVQPVVRDEKSAAVLIGYRRAKTLWLFV